jgi:hypothetical protein
MAIQYLLVTFPEQCAVLADDAGVGFAYYILMLPGILQAGGVAYAQPSGRELVPADENVDGAHGSTPSEFC